MTHHTKAIIITLIKRLESADQTLGTLINRDGGDYESGHVYDLNQEAINMAREFLQEIDSTHDPADLVQ